MPAAWGRFRSVFHVKPDLHLLCLEAARQRVGIGAALDHTGAPPRAYRPARIKFGGDALANLRQRTRRKESSEMLVRQMRT